MKQSDRTVSAPQPPVARSLEVRFGLPAIRLQWGATGAFLCGVLTAIPFPPDGAVMARLFAAWFVAVPLLGAVWVPLLGAQPRLGLRAWLRRGQLGIRRPAGLSGRLKEVLSARTSARPGHLAITVLVTFSLAGLLGQGIDVTVMLTLVLLAMVVLARGEPPAAIGLARSLLEILVPAVIGWLAVGGPAPVPGSVIVNEGWRAAAGLWLRQNWYWPLVCVAFTIVYHGATAVHSRSDLVARRREMAIGFVAVITALAAAQLPLHAGAVALLFAALWPFQSAFLLGHAAWHWRAVQRLDLAAMLLAALGAR